MERSRVSSRVALFALTFTVFGAAVFSANTHFASASTTLTLTPTSAGYYNQWIPSPSSTHYTLVDETPCNTTDYVYTTTTTKRDSYGINISTIGNGALISQVDIHPCASRQTTGTGTATGSVFYRFNGVDSIDKGNFALTGTTPTTTLATTTFPSLNLCKTSTSTFEIGAVFVTGTKGMRLSQIATKLTYSLSTPTSASNLVATNYSSTQNNLTWNDNSNNELMFKVYRAMDSATSYSMVATTTWGTVTSVSYNNTGLTADHTYYYKVVAYNDGGTATSNSAWAITYNSAPVAPSSLTATSSGSDVVLAWTDNSTNEDLFSIERKPSGGSFSQIATTTLNLSGTASYTDVGAASGSYSYRVRAYNIINYSGYSNTADYNITPPPDTVYVSGYIDSVTTWSPIHLYVINGTVTVDQGGTLNIEAGTIVKFGVQGKLTVAGTLNAQGTSGSKIYFTHIYDDTIGGDTNGDNGANSPFSSNYWETVEFDSGGTGTLVNAIVRFGGYTGCCGRPEAELFNNGGTLTVSSTEVATGTTSGVYTASGTSTVFSSNIHDVQFGLKITAGSGDFELNSIHDNYSYGVYVLNGSPNLTLIGNTFANNASGVADISLDGGFANFTHSGNTSSGSGLRGFIMIGYPTSQTWTAGDLPYIISSVSIPAGQTLTLDAGTIVKFNPQGKLIVGGTLNAQGTSGSKIYFTHIYDDTIGGDTNGDNGANSPFSSNYWETVEFDSGGTGTLVNAIVRFGGYTGCCGRPEAELYNAGGTLSVGSSEVATGTTAGVFTSAGSTNISGNSAIHNMANYGLRLTGGTLSVSSSSIYTNGSYGVYASGSAPTLTLVNNQFSAHSSGAAYIDLSSGISFTHSGNTNSGGGMGGFVMDYSLGSDQYWTGGDLPYIVSVVTVPSGTSLVIEQGSVVKFNQSGSKLTIVGTLTALGRLWNPIYFTSIYDDSVPAVGGDTDGDGGVNAPQRGNWDTIEFDSGDSTASSTISQAFIRYGGYTACCGRSSANIYNHGGFFNLRYSTVATSSAYGIYTDSGTTTLVYSQFLNNQTDGIYFNGGTISASSGAPSVFGGNTSYGFLNGASNTTTLEYQYWSATSGPIHSSNPGGAGDRVSDYVDFDPWSGKTHLVMSNTSWAAVRDRRIRWIWNGTPTYSDQWNAAVDTWNALMSISVTSATSTASADLTVTVEYADSGDFKGDDGWYIPGEVHLNSYQLGQYYETDPLRQKTCTHELGHALGLDEGYLMNIMNPYQTYQTTLGLQDVWDYHSLWSN